MDNQRKSHWETVYETKQPNEVSWTQEKPETSLEFIHSFNLPKSAKIIDIGGGDSKLVDYLLDEGFEDITVLDISEMALKKAQTRLGDKASKVKWIVSDITEFEPTEHYDVWHDRATFHFLTFNTQISKYLDTARKAIIHKVGTVAVTSKLGSKDFVFALERNIKELRKKGKSEDGFIKSEIEKNTGRSISTFEYCKPSKFVSLNYEYDSNIITARNMLFEKGELDIYKIIFPVNNFTGCKAQINGLSDFRYFSYFDKIYTKFGKSGILLYNDSGTDELMAGENYVHIYYNGQEIECQKINIILKNCSETDYWNFFREKVDRWGNPIIHKHISHFFELFYKETSTDIKWTIAYNIGLILKLSNLNDKNITISELAQKAYDVYF